MRRIAYLVPEFPGQTHIFFWRECAVLKKLGIETVLVSTRHPPRGLVSHEWANSAEASTFYLNKISPNDLFGLLAELVRAGPAAWIKAMGAALDGCPLRSVPRNLALILAALRLIAFMRANGLEHVHVHSCADAALVAMLASRLSKLRYSMTLHGDLWDYGRQQNVKWRHAAFGIVITRRLLDQVRQQLPNDLPPEIGLAPMGVDPEKFKRQRPYEPWRGDGPLRLVSCGRLNFVKGHQDLISAVSVLRSSGVDVRLEIAGEDDLGGAGFRSELQSLIERLGLQQHVVLLGAVSEARVLQALCDADLFVLASHHEPLGVAIMEAMSCQTPVIATNGGGVPELITHGCEGYLVAPKDPQALAQAIKMLAGNPTMAQQMADAGRSRVVREFNCDISAGELDRLLARTSQ